MRIPAAREEDAWVPCSARSVAAWPPGVKTAALETQETDAGQGEPRRGCWAVAQVRNAPSSSRKETDARPRDWPQRVEGRHGDATSGPAGLSPAPRNSQRLAFGCLTRRARWAGREARPGGSPLPRRGGQHSGWLGLGSSPLGAPYDSDTSRQFPSTSHAPDGVGRLWPGLCAGRCGRLSAQPCPCPSLCSPQCPCSSPTIQKETKLSSLGSLGSIEISARRLRTVPDKQRGQRRSPPLPTCRAE